MQIPIQPQCQPRCQPNVNPMSTLISLQDSVLIPVIESAVAPPTRKYITYGDLERVSRNISSILEYNEFSAPFFVMGEFKNIHRAILNCSDITVKKQVYAHIGKHLIIENENMCSYLIESSMDMVQIPFIETLFDPIIEKNQIMKSFIEKGMNPKTIRALLELPDIYKLESFIRFYGLMSKNIDMDSFVTMIEKCTIGGIRDLFSNSKAFLADPTIVTSDDKCKLISSINKNQRLFLIEKMELINQLVWDSVIVIAIFPMKIRLILIGKIDKNTVWEIELSRRIITTL